MRKGMVGVLTAVLLFTVSAISVSAMEQRYQGGHYSSSVCSGYVDADGNGICDNCRSSRSDCHGYAEYGSVTGGSTTYGSPAAGYGHHGSSGGSHHGSRHSHH